MSYQAAVRRHVNIRGRQPTDSPFENPIYCAANAALDILQRKTVGSASLAHGFYERAFAVKRRFDIFAS